MMARIARVIAPGIPHHVTQRGNRRQATFFSDGDYAAYRDLLAEWCKTYSVEVWAYCLMTNHVHLILVPETEEGLRKAVGETHRRYTRRVNFREGWRGHLWQGRFASYVMDERYLLAAVRYVELNPVKAKIVADPASYRWSSARAHLTGNDDQLVRVQSLSELVVDWDEFLKGGLTHQEIEQIEQHQRTGRPLGSLQFIEELEGRLGRLFRCKKSGPKPKLSSRS